ncbi:hypothetical protein QBC45DRAFT_135516 [Copromyces sp. CBS 386.78]|nr:hypothetical protein QBC45DRAFT_135516 [Copromyces sp. CBS 386.78]
MASIDANVDTARNQSHTCTPKSVTITGPCYRCWDTALPGFPRICAFVWGRKGLGKMRRNGQHTCARPPVGKLRQKHGGRGNGVESKRDSKRGPSSSQAGIIISTLDVLSSDVGSILGSHRHYHSKHLSMLAAGPSVSHSWVLISGLSSTIFFGPDDPITRASNIHRHRFPPINPIPGSQAFHNLQGKGDCDGQQLMCHLGI